MGLRQEASRKPALRAQQERAEIERTGGEDDRRPGREIAAGGIGGDEAGIARGHAETRREQDESRNVGGPEARRGGRQHHQPDREQRAERMEAGDEIDHDEAEEGQVHEPAGAADRAQEAGIDSDDRDAIVAALRQWIAEDRKATPLKALQGLIWEAGYRDGVYRAHVYPEVAARLRAWKARGLPLYVYSSGSVAAQKLFFRYSEAGDLSALFDGHFDTEIGGKREAGSYTRIAAAIGVPPQDILFLSDIVEELDAARAAGLQTTWLCRPPLQCPADGSHRCVGDFDAIAV